MCNVESGKWNFGVASLLFFNTMKKSLLSKYIFQNDKPQLEKIFKIKTRSVSAIIHYSLFIIHHSLILRFTQLFIFREALIKASARIA